MAGMRDEVERHRDTRIAAARRHRARNVRLFGSVATGRDDADSDVDFLVDFESGATLLDLARFRDVYTHAYHRVDCDLMWEQLVTQLPSLREALDRIDPDDLEEG